MLQTWLGVQGHKFGHNVLARTHLQCVCDASTCELTGSGDDGYGVAHAHAYLEQNFGCITSC